MRPNRSASDRLCWLLLAALLVAPLGCASTKGVDDPTSTVAQARSHYDIGLDHLRQQRVALAVRELLLAEKLNPRDPYVHLALAEAYRRRGLLEQARTELNESLAIDPALQSARLNLAAVLIQMERYPESISEGRKLVDDPTFPAPWQALVNIGWAQYRLGQRAEAQASFELALEYQPDFWRAMLNLGILAADGGDRARALARFHEVLAQRPGRFAEAEVNYRIAEIHVAQGDREQALEHLTTVVTNGRSGEWTKRSEEMLALLR
jgi:Tfp pilus assembly protein PilF